MMNPTQATSHAPEHLDRSEAPTPRRGLLAGFGAGIVAIGCCVGPTVAALLGLMSAATAADLADDLYSEWGWAFKLMGIAAGGAALILARRRARACGASRRSLAKFALVLVVSGIVSYFAVYATTTWLGDIAT